MCAADPIQWQKCKFEHNPRREYTYEAEERAEYGGRRDGESAEVYSEVEVGPWEGLEDGIAEKEITG